MPGIWWHAAISRAPVLAYHHGRIQYGGRRGEPMAVFGDRILRCSDGHLFMSSESSRLFGSVHMGPLRKMQCPVDGKIVTCGNVREASLTPEQLEEARRYKT
jgi:hypothetical protein